MNILVVSQYYYPEPFRINEICEELVRRGHRVTVLTTNPNYPDGEIYSGYLNAYNEEVINGVKVIRCKSRPRHRGAKNLALNYISFVLSATKMVSKLDNNFDLVYTYQLSPITSCIPAIKYKKKNNVPVFLYCLDIWPESLKGSALEKGLIFRIFGLLSKKIYRSADKIAVTSPCFIPYIGNTCAIFQNDISVLYQHSSNIAAIDKVPPNLEAFLDYVNFMFIGNIGESQNLECIIKAVSQIKNKSKMRFHVVGSGSFLEKAKQLTHVFGVDHIFIFHGRFPKSEMTKFYSIANVCVVSLKDEGITGYTIPGKVQEYMSAGKTILACINGDAIDLVNSCKCGIGVTANDDKQLAIAIDELIENKNQLVEYGKNGKNFYAQNFTLEKHVDELLKLLVDLK